MSAADSKRNRPLIRVYLITHRRSHLLKRAIASVLNQSYRRLELKIVNDAPDDLDTANAIAGFSDERLSLFLPLEKRGPTRNFNLPFAQKDADFVSILEDDNWWEPDFLEAMYAALMRHPEVSVAVGNERIWREEADGSWEDTGRTIWDFRDERAFEYTLEDICGHATICNSAMLIRLRPDDDCRTPDEIPVDVTEHFRERTFRQPILRVGRPMVNYAETLQSARSKDGVQWGCYQCLLIGSVFAAIPESRNRATLAQQLWRLCPSKMSPRAVTMIATGLFVRQARALLLNAPAASLFRFMLWAVRHPRQLMAMTRVDRKFDSHFQFLVNAPLTRHLVDAIYQ